MFCMIAEQRMSEKWGDLVRRVEGECKGVQGLLQNQRLM